MFYDLVHHPIESDWNNHLETDVSGSVYPPKDKLKSIRGRFHIVAAQNDGPQIGKVGIDMIKLFEFFLRTQEYN